MAGGLELAGVREGSDSVHEKSSRAHEKKEEHHANPPNIFAQAEREAGRGFAVAHFGGIPSSKSGV